MTESRGICCIVGAGAVGGYVGGMMGWHKQPIVFLCRPATTQILLEKGLHLESAEGHFHVPVRPYQPGSFSVDEPCVFITSDPAEAIREAELVFLTVKSQDTEAVAQSIQPHLKENASIVLLQNGVRNLEMVQRHIPNHTCLEAVVLFNSLSLNPGEITLTATESVILDSEVEQTRVGKLTAENLRMAGIQTRFHANVHGILWTKLIINLNNGLSAITGSTLFEGLTDCNSRLLSRLVMTEGMDVLKKAQIALEPIPKVDPARLLWLLRAPGWMAVWVMKTMLKPYQDVQSSTWQSRVRGQKTEIEFLNGEIVRLGEKVGMRATLNQKVVEIVHQLEEEGSARKIKPGELRKLLGV